MTCCQLCQEARLPNNRVYAISMCELLKGVIRAHAII